MAGKKKKLAKPRDQEENLPEISEELLDAILDQAEKEKEARRKTGGDKIRWFGD